MSLHDVIAVLGDQEHQAIPHEYTVHTHSFRIGSPEQEACVVACAQVAADVCVSEKLPRFNQLQLLPALALHIASV